MSAKHPIVVITGSSGAGTSSVTRTFQHIFRREQINAAIVEGDSFHRYDREQMKAATAAAGQEGNYHFCHFSPEANLLEELETLFREYGEHGRGKVRKYLHDPQEAKPHGQQPGTFTPWEDVDPDSDLLFYEGLHGAAVTGKADVAQHADLLVGVVPIINLEWIQKLHRDKTARGYTSEDVVDTVLRRMPDYVNYICPQFSRTHVNFQRVPTVDTSNPFIALDIPSADESFVVIRFARPKGIDFPYLLSMLHDSFMSRPNIIVVPGGKMELAMQLIFTPLILRLMAVRRQALASDPRPGSAPAHAVVRAYDNRGTQEVGQLERLVSADSLQATPRRTANRSSSGGGQESTPTRCNDQRELHIGPETLAAHRHYLGDRRSSRPLGSNNDLICAPTLDLRRAAAGVQIGGSRMAFGSRPVTTTRPRDGHLSHCRWPAGCRPR